MKQNHSKRLNQALSILISAGCSLSMLQMPVLAVPENLENRAKDFSIQVSSEQSGKPKENMVDGDTSTLWVNNGAEWPNQIVFEAPMNHPAIYKMVVKLESGHPAWTMDMKLQHAVNSVTDDLILDKEVNDHSFPNEFTYTWEDGISPSHLYLTLSDPKINGSDATFWPGIAEVEIYTEKDAEEPEPTNLVNIAPNGTISSITSGQGNPSSLVDENYKSLYVFSQGLSTTDGQAWVQIDYDQKQTVKAIEAAFENLGASDPSSFVFTYDILGRASADGEWEVLAADQKATRLENDCIKMFTLDSAKELQAVRILIKSITNTAGDPWPALAELKILAPKDTVKDPLLDGNIAQGKSIHTNTGQANVSSLIDGSLATQWSGDMYPAYVDIDLGKNYTLSDAVVFTPTSGYSQYSIYTSMDGVDFDRVARKTTKDSCTAEGETWQLGNKEARIVRLYMEYNSASERSQVREFVLHGTESGTPVQETPEISVPDFKDTEYANPVTQADTIAEVQGIISRRLGEQYADWFTFELKDAADGYDYYDVEAKDGKIHITGNNGVSLATGLNAYLEKVVNVHISQVGDQVTMPESIVLPSQKLHKETKFPVRYSYNFCTLSYSMAFWGETEWRNELDWLALNGVNIVLDATGQEEVWRRFLSECGYSHQEIKDFIAGPAYYAWFYMANLTGMGGPLPDAWFAQRAELARKNHRTMQVLGMQPVLMGYCGMVPTDFAQKQPNASVITQGAWCNFQRPYMLKTDDPNTFPKYAEMFYKAQKDVYGDITNYYATDPFHEGGNTGGMNVTTIASETLKAMMNSDPDAVWVIQSWQRNPSSALLAGLEGNREHALVLDLYAERQPHWNNSYYGDEFQQTPWVFCMLNNFGGRLGLYGHIEGLEGVFNAINNADCMAGIGIAPEASQNNPLLYEYLFDTIWTEDASQPVEPIDLDQWIKDYARRRYGGESESAIRALQILIDTVYDGIEHERNNSGIGQGAPENILNARPDLTLSTASTWGWSSILYSKVELQKALELLLEDWDTLKDSEGYRYDVVNVAQQVLSNSAQGILSKMNTAYSNRDLEEFTLWSDKLIELVSDSDQLLSTTKMFMLGNWTEAAGRMISDPDDFTKDLFDLNAKALVSTWGSIRQSNTGGLHDYSNRQWAGLTKDLYLERWQLFINEKKKELRGESSRTFSAANWFEIEWAWARNSDARFSDQPSSDPINVLAEKVLEDYDIQDIAPEITLDGVLDRTKMTASAGSYHSGDEPANVLDDNNSTIWHTNYTNSDGCKREECTLTLDLESPAYIRSLLYMPRGGASNGTITQYKVEVYDGTAQSPEWTTVSTGSWARESGWKEAAWVTPTKATKVRLTALDSYSNQSGRIFASAAEVRLKGNWDTQHTVTFDLQDGSASKSIEVQEGSLVTAPETPEREGYLFGGWFTDPACTSAFHFDSDTVSDDLTLYAKWTIKPVGLDYTLIDAALTKASQLDSSLDSFKPAGKAAFGSAKSSAADKKTTAQTQEELDAAAKALNQAMLALRLEPAADRLP